MSFLLLIRLACPTCPLCMVELANKSPSTCNGGGELRPSCDGHAARIELRLR